MDALGAATSALELAQKINSLRIAVKDAPGDWSRYCQGLQAVVCIQNALDFVRSKYPSICDLQVQINERESPVPLVNHVNKVLSMIVDQAKALLARHRQLGASRRLRIKGIFWRLRFALDKDTIAKMIESVEEARDHLHMALMLASLHSSSAWHTHAGNLLSEIQADMKKHGEVLKRLENRVDLREIPLELDTQGSLFHGGDSPSSAHVAEKTSTPRGDFKAMFHPGFGFSSSSQKKTRRKAREGIASRTRKSARNAEASRHAAQKGVVEDRDDGDHEADDESGDDAEPPNGNIANAGTQDTFENMQHAPEYAIVIVDNKWTQVPVDSETYRSADDCRSLDNSHASPPAASAAIRVEDVIESLSESEWDEARHLSAEELKGYLTSAPRTEYATDVETTIRPRSPIIIDTRHESYISISQTVHLTRCRAEKGSRVRKFCVERVSVTDNTQVFCVIEPCNEQYDPKCKHITVEVDNGDVFAVEELPSKIQLASLRVGRTSSNGVEGSSDRRDDTVASLSGSRCKGVARGRCHHHTVFDQDSRVECALAVELFASAQLQPDDSDASTERVASEAEDDTDETDHDHHDGPATRDDEFPTCAGPDDDEHAFKLLRMMVLDDMYELPHKIGLVLLIRFLSLIDKYSQHVGEGPLNQARLWASLIQPPETWTKHAVPLLWVMWKLRMGPEFKNLSSTIQQCARSSISQWQDGPDNEYHIKLPETILNQLDARRIEVLSTVRDRMAVEIEMYCQKFHDAAERGILRQELEAHLGAFMASFFVLGYLKLQRDRFLKARNSDQDQGVNPDFCGVSIAGITKSALLMVELGEWMACWKWSKPNWQRATAQPSIAGLLARTICPLFRREGLSTQLRGGFKHQLNSLIEEMKREGWGIDLNQIGQ